MHDILDGHARRHLLGALMASFLATSSGATERSVDARAPATHTVVIEAMEFSPRVLEVRSGDTVVWVNKDAFPHNATANDRSFKSKDITPGAKSQVKVTEKGAHAYICTLHPTMKAELVVK